MKKPLHMLCGVNIGDYEFIPETILDVLKKYKFGKVEDGNLFRFLSIRVDWNRPTSEQLYSWAKFFKENEVYFCITNNYNRYKDIPLTLTKEETEKIGEIAGEYFLGDEIGEFGGFYATRAKGYLRREPCINPVQGLNTCVDAVENYKLQIGKLIKKMRDNGAKNVSAVQAVTLTPYDYEAGIDDVIVEVAPRNMEQIMNFARGAKRAYKRETLGAWLAHEWYGGFHQFDNLKAKRFTAEYYSLYLAGFDTVCLESGFRKITSHVDAVIPEGEPLPNSYLKETEDFAKFCNADIRPGENGPITKIAFVQGNLDGFGWGNSSSLWGQYFDEKWGFSAPEYSYKVLDDVYRSCEWHEERNFGDYEYSGAPAYGQYDVIPATTPLDVMKQYEWVIFCGWNTMTPEIVDTLKAYVKGGGKLLITAAHVRDSIDRAEKGNFVPGIEELLGVKLSDDILRTNDGYKFAKYSTIDGVMYPGTKKFLCDPAWSGGYTNYVKFEPTTATTVCYVSDSFFPEPESQIPFITENKYGEGNVIFMANSEYPGDSAVFPIYKFMVKAALTASHRMSDLQVIASDKLRFAMYEGDDFYKLYLFNTDFSNKIFAKVIFRGEEREALIDSVGLEIMEFKK